MKMSRLRYVVLIGFFLSGFFLGVFFCRQKKHSSWKAATSSQVLKFLKQHGIKVHDLMTISNAGEFGMDLEGSEITDLQILEGMPLKSLVVSKTGIRDLAPISEMHNLRKLNVASTEVVDLTPLKNLTLQEINITNTKITDLSPLTNMPLKVLSMIHTDVKDLSLLQSLPLEEIYFSAGDARLEQTIDVLRNMKSLRCLNYYGSVDEFWRDYDSGVFKRPPWTPQGAFKK